MKMIKTKNLTRRELPGKVKFNEMFNILQNLIGLLVGLVMMGILKMADNSIN